MPVKRKGSAAQGAGPSKKAKTAPAKGKAPAKKAAAAKGKAKAKPKPNVKIVLKKPSAAKKTAAAAKKAAVKKVVSSAAARARSASPAKKPATPQGRSKSAPAKKTPPAKSAVTKEGGSPAKKGPGRPKVQSPPTVKRVTAQPIRSSGRPSRPSMKKLNLERPPARETTPPPRGRPRTKPPTPQKTPDKRSPSQSGSPGPSRSPKLGSKSPGSTPTKSQPPALTPGKSPKIFACSICEEVFYTSFGLWAHKRDIHENPPLMSPERAIAVLAAAEKRAKAQAAAAKAAKRKLELDQAAAAQAAKRKLALEAKNKALAVSRRRVETRDTEMARQMHSVDTEVGALIKREKLELLKGRVVQLRKETGKPAPRGKKRVLPQTEKEINNMMAQVEKLLPSSAKRARQSDQMTVKEQLDDMETKLDLGLRRLKQEADAGATSPPERELVAKVTSAAGIKVMTPARKIVTASPVSAVTKSTPKKFKMMTRPGATKPVPPLSRPVVRKAVSPVTRPVARKPSPKAGGSKALEPGEVVFSEEGEVFFTESTEEVEMDPGEVDYREVQAEHGEISYREPGEVVVPQTAQVALKKLPVRADVVVTPPSARSPKAVTLLKPAPSKAVTAGQLVKTAAKTPQVHPNPPKSPVKYKTVVYNPKVKIAPKVTQVKVMPEIDMDDIAGVDKVEVIYRCANTKCMEQFTDYETLRKHEEECARADGHASGTYTCAECGLCFNSQLMLTRHKSQKFGCAAVGKRLVIEKSGTPSQQNMPTMVKCLTCDRFFANQANMRQHARHCIGPIKQRKDIKCPICNKAFTTVQHLQVHCSADHNFNTEASNQVVATGRNKYVPSKGVTCLDCGEWFQARLELIQHKRTCGKEGFSKEAFTCSICDAKCYTRVSLYDHMKTAHGDDKVADQWLAFACSVCKQICGSAKELQDHRTEKHSSTGAGPLYPQDGKTATKVFVCFDCQRSFTDRQALLKHKMDAHGEKVFSKCWACGVTFKDRVALHEHFSKVHKNKVMLPADVVKRATEAAAKGQPAIIDLTKAVTCDATTAPQMSVLDRGLSLGSKKQVIVPSAEGTPAPMLVLDLQKLQEMVTQGKGQVFVPQSYAKQRDAQKAAAEWNKERQKPATVTAPVKAAATAAKLAADIVKTVTAPGKTTTQTKTVAPKPTAPGKTVTAPVKTVTTQPKTAAPKPVPAAAAGAAKKPAPTKPTATTVVKVVTAPSSSKPTAESGSSPVAKVTTARVVTPSGSPAAKAVITAVKHKPAILRTASPKSPQPEPSTGQTTTSPVAKARIVVKTTSPSGKVVAAQGVQMLQPIDKNRMKCMGCMSVLSSMVEIASHSCGSTPGPVSQAPDPVNEAGDGVSQEQEDVVVTVAQPGKGARGKRKETGEVEWN